MTAYADQAIVEIAQIFSERDLRLRDFAKMETYVQYESRMYRTSRRYLRFADILGVCKNYIDLGTVAITVPVCPDMITLAMKIQEHLLSRWRLAASENNETTVAEDEEDNNYIKTKNNLTFEISKLVDIADESHATYSFLPTDKQF